MTLTVQDLAATTSYTLALEDVDDMLLFYAAASTTVTIPPDSSVAFPSGTTISLAQMGTGQVFVYGGSGVTLRPGAGSRTRAQYSAMSLIKLGPNLWIAFGDLSV